MSSNNYRQVFIQLHQVQMLCLKPFHLEFLHKKGSREDSFDHLNFVVEKKVNISSTSCIGVWLFLYS